MICASNELPYFGRLFFVYFTYFVFIRVCWYRSRITINPIMDGLSERGLFAFCQSINRILFVCTNKRKEIKIFTRIKLKDRKAHLI